MSSATVPHSNRSNSMKRSAAIIALCLTLLIMCSFLSFILLVNSKSGSAFDVSIGACTENSFIALTNIEPGTRSYWGWELRDSTGVHDLPTFNLKPREQIRIWRGVGQSDEHSIYLGQAESLWHMDRGEVVIISPPSWGSNPSELLGCPNLPGWPGLHE
jgi:hypothetical protein